MSDTPPARPSRSIASRAAKNGVYLSACICALLLLWGAMTAFPVAGLALWMLSLAMPFILYRLLRDSSLECGGLSFAEIWAEGIASFFLGSLVPAVVAYALLRFAFPTFIADQVHMAVASLENMETPQAAALADSLEAIYAKGALPSAADVAANIISFNIVAGTFLSLLATPFVKLRTRNARTK